MPSKAAAFAAISWRRANPWLDRLATVGLLAGFVVMKHDLMVPLLCVGYMLSGPLRFFWRQLTGHREDAPLV